MPGAIIRNPTPDWLKPENASVFDSYWKQIARKVGHLIGADDPAAQVMTPLMTDASAAGTSLTAAAQAVVDAAKELPGAQRLADFVKTIRGYHGSPHDFAPVEGAPLGRFDSTKIGTGEGAQAYGHGHYIAEREGVAQGYRDALARGDASGIMPTQPGRWNRGSLTQAGSALKEANGDVAGAVQRLRDRARRLPNAQTQEAADYLERGWYVPDPEPPGKMYEVQIKADPAHFLDWDAPLSAQSPQVQQGVAKAYGDIRPVRRADGMYSITSVDPDGSGRMLDYGFKEPTAESAIAKFHEAINQQPGSLAYREIASRDQARASALMREAGVPGIKYLDQGSRAAGEGTRNYVVFPGNEHLIDILRKYGILPPVAGLGYLSQVGQAPKAEPR